MRPTKRSTQICIYAPLPGETTMLYEMGIPVVETLDTWHIDICQKVPLNMERDNVTPAFLTSVRVAVLNEMHGHLNAKLATEPWVRLAGSNSLCNDDTTRHLCDLRYGSKRVSYDVSDIGSNREAASQDYTVIHGGSQTAGEWANSRRAGTIPPAGQIFPTDHPVRIPAKVYTRKEWTREMSDYAAFVERVSPDLVAYRVSIEFIEDKAMVHGQFFGPYFHVNLAYHDAGNWQQNIELMLHELAHTVVQSNDHLIDLFYRTVGSLGAKLAVLLASDRLLAPNISRSRGE